MTLERFKRFSDVAIISELLVACHEYGYHLLPSAIPPLNILIIDLIFFQLSQLTS